MLTASQILKSPRVASPIHTKRLAPITNTLQERRQSFGLTQQEVSSELGMTRAHLAMIEGGHCTPRLDKALKLAAFYECRVDDLFQLVGES